MTAYNSGYRATKDLPLANHDSETRYQVGVGYPVPPRPEYDVPDNPILALWRSVSSAYRYTEVELGPISGSYQVPRRLLRQEYLDLLGMWLDDPDEEWTKEGEMGIDTTAPERQHARRVLELVYKHGVEALG